MSETKAPTPDEVANARIYFAEPLDVVDRVLPQMARHVRVLLAALDAAERERDEARARYDAAAAENATLKDERDGAMDERDKAYLRLDAERALARKEPS